MLRALSPRAPSAGTGRARALSRRTVVLAAAALAGVLLIVLLATGWAGGGNSGVTESSSARLQPTGLSGTGLSARADLAISYRG